MPAAPKVQVWVCAACHGIYWPEVVKARGVCPSCSNPYAEGELRDRKDDE